MAKIKKRGEAGAAKNYITRNQALKKLQLTLADFRRLCILKGIHPRAPRHAKRANKGSTAPASFYYAKDIAFLAHEPVLQTLRAHKAFAKKLSRAVGRQEWGLAKGLQESKPVARLDHIIRERYPTFDDSLRDLDDALSLLTLFAALPASDHVAAALVAKCARLVAEWQLYVVRAQALRKVFLSIKGVYFQAEVRGQTITWLVPYLFTQHVPQDVDFRIMSTFIELYQTLLGFVLFRLYTDLNLVYPPALEAASDDAGAGPLGALRLVEQSQAPLGPSTEAGSVAAGKKVSSRDVKKAIKAIAQQDAPAEADDAESTEAVAPAADDAVRGDEFTEAPSKDGTSAGLVSLAALDGSAGASSVDLFAPYYFYISRECPRGVVEFVLRSFGAPASHVGWDAVLGAGSAFDASDERITHMIVDRPPAAGASSGASKLARVQPQWVVDSANAGAILPTGPYAPGAQLPPHLSPFVDDAAIKARGGYAPREAALPGADTTEAAAEEAAESSEDEEEEEEAATEEAIDAEVDENARPALAALLADPLDEAGAGLEAAAELEAEAAGGEDELAALHAAHAAASKRARKLAKAAADAAPATASQRPKASAAQQEEDEARSMAKMLMSNKQRKLYTKLSYSQGKRSEETARLEQKRAQLDRDERRGKGSAQQGAEEKAAAAGKKAPAKKQASSTAKAAKGKAARS